MFEDREFSLTVPEDNQVGPIGLDTEGFLTLAVTADLHPRHLNTLAVQISQHHAQILCLIVPINGVGKEGNNAKATILAENTDLGWQGALMLLGIGDSLSKGLGGLTLMCPGESAGVCDVLVMKAPGEVDEVSLRTATLVGLHVRYILAIASRVEHDCGQATDVVALGNAAVRIGVDDGKADVTAHFLGGGNKIRPRQVAVIAPRSCEHNEPDLVAALNDLVEVCVVQVDDVAALVVLSEVRVGNVLKAVLGRAEIVH